MRVEQLGTGSPSVAIVGAIHGDEPCGARAIERLLEDAPDVDRPAKLVIANEEALERGVRYIDADLNRSFDDPAEGTHEHRLARRLAEELAGSTVLSIHSTRSHPEPFGIVDGTAEPVPSICPYLSIDALVDIGGTVEGRLFEVEADLIEVETGLQGTDAAVENAYRLAREFLTAADVLPGRTVGRDLPIFRLGEPLAKPTARTYQVLVENFSRVEAGEPFARADGAEIVADRPFHPVLVSADGYDGIFGYAADRAGTLEVPTGERRTA